MTLIVLVLVILLLFGGGGFYGYGRSPYLGGGIGVVGLLIIALLIVYGLPG